MTPLPTAGCMPAGFRVPNTPLQPYVQNDVVVPRGARMLARSLVSQYHLLRASPLTRCLTAPYSLPCRAYGGSADIAWGPDFVHARAGISLPRRRGARRRSVCHALCGGGTGRRPHCIYAHARQARPSPGRLSRDSAQRCARPIRHPGSGACCIMNAHAARQGAAVPIRWSGRSVFCIGCQHPR
jgi:hypothetical protein